MGRRKPIRTEPDDDFQPMPSQPKTYKERIRAPHEEVKPIGPRQQMFIDMIDLYPVVICSGVSGSGKTFLATTKGLEFLDRTYVDQMILTKPLQTAGESYGFIPGDLSAKLAGSFASIEQYISSDPNYERYLGLGSHKPDVARIISVPIATMRGRDFTNAYIVVDEFQNTTIPQAQMILTRLGQGSKLVIIGDVKQCDLREPSRNGLSYILRVLNGHPEIGFVEFLAEDIQRHGIVRDFLRAFDAGHSLWDGSSG